MNDSSSFSSLLALVDNHLSQSNVPETESVNPQGHSSKAIAIPLNNGIRKGMSDSRLSSPSQRFIESHSSMSVSPIKSVLVEQVTNMLKAKEHKYEDNQVLDVKLNELTIHSNDDSVDLITALGTPFENKVFEENILSTSTTSSSLYLHESDDFPIEEIFDKSCPENNIQNLQPCKRDMSYILHNMIHRAKCSTFGKIVSARIKPIPVPYLKEQVTSNIVPFDFKTKSPCDMIKDRLNKSLLLMEIN
ncbi:uncharacterized protein LOC114245698 [Bombyx mandarina]|uniref:Uncharacterized protein LOC114245698 n=1 Tax=Bombyx mandarina TaxID=7092 RepID=A0A6J2JWI0_BOMMA|nr:uncharacterized protein LOC114245698 [Bombyx mandarina]